MHGSYGVEGDHVVLTDTLELENLDFSEFEASFDSHHAGAGLAPRRARAVPGKVMHMGIFDRLSTMLRSNINDLISPGRKPGEDAQPAHRRHEDAAGQGQAAGGLGDRRREEAPGRRRDHEEAGRGLGAARHAGGAGGPRRPRQAGAAAATTSTLQGAQQLHETWLKHKAETEKLKLSLRQLNDKIEEAKRKKNILVARAKRAEAQQRIQETMSGMSDKSAFESFERMAEKIEATERKAIAAAELKEEFSGDQLVKQFEALEYHGSSDQQLLELKAKMGLLGAGGAKETRQIGKGGETSTRRKCWRSRRTRTPRAEPPGTVRPEGAWRRESPLPRPFSHR